MSDLILHEPLATEVRQMAEGEGLPAEEVVEAAIRQYRVTARHKKLKAEAEWWANTPAEFRAQYANRYVAVLKGQVVDDDADEDILFERVYQQFSGEVVLITPAQGRPIIRIRHPRIERL